MGNPNSLRFTALGDRFNAPHNRPALLFIIPNDTSPMMPCKPRPSHVTRKQFSVQQASPLSARVSSTFRCAFLFLNYKLLETFKFQYCIRKNRVNVIKWNFDIDFLRFFGKTFFISDKYEFSMRKSSIDHWFSTLFIVFGLHVWTIVSAWCGKSLWLAVVNSFWSKTRPTVCSSISHATRTNQGWLYMYFANCIVEFARATLLLISRSSSYLLLGFCALSQSRSLAIH